MKIPRTLLVAIVAMVGVAASTFVHRGPSDVRSVAPISAPAADEPFDREQSAALFVGVRGFTHRIDPVLYAVDDAVDLAYMFSLEPRVGLVRPDRVVLALSGRPHKIESKERLRWLKEHGARIVDADAANIVDSLKTQAALAGRGGLLVLSLATHGFARNGESFVLGASSLMGDPETTLSTTRLLDIIARSGAQRSLVFIDACRNNAERGFRGLPATFLNRMRGARGQAILYAAAPGGVAVEGDGNGVFTSAVLDGLQCKASAPRGIVTAETLSRYVDHTVRERIRRAGNVPADPGIQSTFDRTAKNMPLALCWVPRSLPAQARVSGSKLIVSTEDGERLWERDLGSPIIDAKVADLDALDGRPEVVAATAHAIRALTYDNRVLWTETDERTLRAFTVGDLFRKHNQQIVALWSDSGSATQLNVYAGDGHSLATSDYPGYLDHVAIARPTSHHAPKIVAAGMDGSGAAAVALFNPMKIATGKALWSRRLSPRRESVASLSIVDRGRYGVRDIAVGTSGGKTLILDFDGNVLSRR